MSRRMNRTHLALPLLAAAALASASCSKKEEAPAPSTPVAASGATAATDEWAWADAPTRGSAATPSAPTAPDPAAAEPATSPEWSGSRPVSTPPPAQKPPKPKEPKPKPAEEPVNNFEEAPYGDDAPAPAPVKVAYTAPAGTPVEARLDAALDSATAQVGQAITATLDADLTDGAGHVVLPRGTRLVGTVTEAVSARKVKKKSALACQFSKAELPDGSSVPVSAGQRLEGKGYTKKDAAIIGGSAAGGAVLGQVLGGDTEATAAGAILGGAIGTGVAMSRKGEDVRIEAGTVIELTMEVPVTVETTAP